MFAPVGAVEQVAVEALPGLPLVLLHHRHGAVGMRAAGVQTVPPGVHPARGQQVRGPLLDGGLGLDDALPDAAEVAHAGVGDAAQLVGLFLLELLAEFLQQLLHPGYFGFQVRYRRGPSVDAAARSEQERGRGEQHPGGMLRKSHVAVVAVVVVGAVQPLPPDDGGEDTNMEINPRNHGVSLRFHIEVGDERDEQEILRRCWEAAVVMVKRETAARPSDVTRTNMVSGSSAHLRVIVIHG